MKIVNQISKDELSTFLIKQKYSEFLQSWEWGEFAKKENAGIMRIGVEDNDELVAAATLIKKKVFSLNYWFCPCGPVTSYKADSNKIVNFLFDEICVLAKKEDVIFLRFEPGFIIRNLSFVVQKTIDIQPSKTSIVNLEKSEEELLACMHQKTRYNIRLAEKKGVKIREGEEEDFVDFWKIMEETVNRDDFRLHSKEHYQGMLKLDKNFVKLFLAEYNEKVIAAVLSVFFGDTITYVHGASANEYRNVMAPYLLHWNIMKLGKSLGYKYYDLNGVDENKWPGVTRFKKGFGGEQIEYPGTFDLVMNKKFYNIYRLIRKLRRLI